MDKAWTLLKEVEHETYTKPYIEQIFQIYSKYSNGWNGRLQVNQENQRYAISEMLKLINQIYGRGNRVVPAKFKKYNEYTRR